MADSTANSTQELKNNLKQDAKAAKDEIAGQAKVKAESGKQQAANKLNDLSDSIEKLADNISENDKLGLASYVHSASSKLTSLATRLQESSVDELAEDAKELARNRPTAFLLGSVVLGFGLSRFIKASTHHASSSASASTNAQSSYKASENFAPLSPDSYARSDTPPSSYSSPSSTPGI